MAGYNPNGWPTDSSTSMPSEIVAGDTVIWTQAVQGYAANQNWTLTYYLQMNGQPVIPLTTTANPDGSSFDVNASTPAWLPGQYTWKAVISGTGPNVGQRYTLAWGDLVVRPDPTKTSDSRSHWRKCYDAVTAVLEGQMSDPIVRYKLGDTEAFKLPHVELIKLQAFYAGKLRIEAGRKLISVHQVTFK